MQNLYFDDQFPGISIATHINKSSFSSAITEECRVLQCSFNNQNNGPVINANSGISKFQIDKTAFAHCQSSTSSGAIKITANIGSFIVISRTCAVDCQAGSAFSGNFARITVGERSSIAMDMSSVDQCEKESMSTYHPICIEYGDQSVSNLNNTNCKCLRNSGLSNRFAHYGCSKYCNIVSNVAKEALILHSFPYTVYKFFNIIGNKCFLQSSGYVGLIYTSVSGSYFSISSSFIFGNTCLYVFQNEGVIRVSGSKLDSVTYTGNSVSIIDNVENDEYQMTLLASCGLHAVLPYGIRQGTEDQHRSILPVVCFVLSTLTLINQQH